MIKEKDVKITKRCSCYKCGHESHITWNVTKQKWSRTYVCPKCKSGSFQYYNF